MLNIHFLHSELEHRDTETRDSKRRIDYDKNNFILFCLFVFRDGILTISRKSFGRDVETRSHEKIEFDTEIHKYE